MFGRTRVAALVAAAALLLLSAEAHAGTATIRYGPYTVPGASGDMPAMLTKLQFTVKRPCSDCYITAFVPNLTYADADHSTANYNTGMMLHHVVFASQFRSDATCSGTWLGLAGERFFASGNERSPINFPFGYGYRVRWYDSWTMLVELMNMMPDPQEVYVDVTYTTVPSGTPGMHPVKPLWLDMNPCSDSEYSIPSGWNEQTKDWTSTLEGKLVAMIGHVHDYGISVETTNESQGSASVCKSTADYAGTPHVVHMSECVGDPAALVHDGDVLRLHTIYDSPTPRDDVMGIMLGYVYRTPL